MGQDDTGQVETSGRTPAPVLVDAVDAETLDRLNASTDDELDALIRRDVRTAIDVASALVIRRQRGTWRETHRSWDEFCRDRYGFTRSTAWRRLRQIDAHRADPDGPVPSQREATKSAAGVAGCATEPEPVEPVRVAPRPRPAPIEATAVEKSAPERPVEGGGAAVVLADDDARTVTGGAGTALELCLSIDSLTSIEAAEAARLIGYDNARGRSRALLSWAAGFDLAVRGMGGVRGVVSTPAGSPNVCRHPKDQERKFPYGVFCGVCDERIR